MTCIVGLVDDNKIYMGADSAGVDGYSLTVRKDEKVFINGDFIMGFTSSFRMGQRFRYSFTPPTHNKEIEIYRYMVSEFAESIRKLFKDHGYATIENSSESGGTFLVGYSGRLFQIGDDFQVGESILNFDIVVLIACTMLITLIHFAVKYW